MGRYNDAGLTDFNWSADPNRGYAQGSDSYGAGPSYRDEVMQDIYSMRDSIPYNGNYYSGGGGGSYAGGGGLPSYMDDDAIKYYEQQGINSMATPGQHVNLNSWGWNQAAQPHRQGSYASQYGLQDSSVNGLGIDAYLPYLNWMASLYNGSLSEPEGW